MKRFENLCVDCDIPCDSSSCNCLHVPIRYCDICGEYAEYQTDNRDFCSECLFQFLQEIFDESDLKEKAKILGININMVDEEFNS